MKKRVAKKPERVWIKPRVKDLKVGDNKLLVLACWKTGGWPCGLRPNT
jgi:hypothetical protein